MGRPLVEDVGIRRGGVGDVGALRKWIEVTSCLLIRPYERADRRIDRASFAGDIEDGFQKQHERTARVVAVAEGLVEECCDEILHWRIGEVIHAEQVAVGGGVHDLIALLLLALISFEQIVYLAESTRLRRFGTDIRPFALSQGSEPFGQFLISLR